MFISVVKNLKGDDYTAHKTLAKTFHGQKILFQRRRVSIYVLSPLPSFVQSDCCIDVTHFIDDIKIGDYLDFSIRINPVISKKTNTTIKRGVRKAVPSHDIKRWLNNKFIQYGFWADFSYDQEHFRESIKNGSRISIASFMVYGTLEVLCPDSVRHALMEGIGRGKGFGFGMLNVYDSLTAGFNIQ